MLSASVIIPARNAAATLGRTLEALSAQDFDGRFEVIVVDDGSEDGTASIAERAPGGARVIRQAPAGPAAARNRGVAAAEGEALAFTDADCSPQPGWLRAGVAALATADLVQGRVVPDPGVIPGPFDRTVAVDGEHGLYETANLFVRRRTFDSVHGFEDWLGARLGKQLAEDLWFAWRAKRGGATTAYCAEAVVEHAVFPRGPAAYAAERARLVYFPAIARQIPELRSRFFWRHWFLNRRSAVFDAAAASLAVSVAARTALPLVGALPYLRLVAGRARPWGRRAPVVALGDLAADAVGMAALIAGSARNRSLLL